MPEIDDELPVDADAPERRRDATQLAEAVRRVLGRFKVNDDAWLPDLLACWPEMAGSDVAAVARPGKCVSGVLYVYVCDSIRLFELRRAHLKRLEEAVRARFGTDRIRHVRLVIDPDCNPLNSQSGR